MRLANGVGSVYKLSGNRRNPYIVRKTIGWEIDPESGKTKQNSNNHQNRKHFFHIKIYFQFCYYLHYNTKPIE